MEPKENLFWLNSRRFGHASQTFHFWWSTSVNNENRSEILRERTEVIDRERSGESPAANFNFSKVDFAIYVDGRCVSPNYCPYCPFSSR